MKKILIIVSAVFVSFTAIYFQFLSPKKTESANFTSASATLSNSRYSYKASVATGSSGSPTVTIDSASGDDDTEHLFPGDTICFVNSAESGCIGNTEYTVANIVDSTTFNTTGALADALVSTDFVVATQSGTLTLAFTTVAEIPINGDILVTIPALNTTNKTDDGIPDTGASSSVNGFDIQTTATSDVAVTGCTDVNWTVASVTAGTASADHLILITRATSACAASSAITITIDSDPGLINPAVVDGYSRGTAANYAIDVTSRDVGDNELDTIDVLVAPVEGVLVSATVDETLGLTIAGVSADSGTYCNITRTASSPDTTAVSVPWGTLSATYLAATHNTQQTVTVSTNADAGYSVYIEENDQMGKDGVGCTGTGAGESDNCIKDTVCDGVGCDESTLKDWTADPSSYEGLGYSLEETSGTDAVFEWDDSGAAFNAKQIADVAEGGETRQAIMTNAGQVSGNAINVCFRIDITGTQPAGYYYNKIKYTAVATF